MSTSHKLKKNDCESHAKFSDRKSMDSVNKPQLKIQ